MYMICKHLSHDAFAYTHFKCQTVLFELYIVPYQVLPLRVRVDLGTMALKGYSAFPKTPVLLEPHDKIV